MPSKRVDASYNEALVFLEGWHDRLAEHGPAVLGEFIVELNHTRLKLIKLYYGSDDDASVPPCAE